MNLQKFQRQLVLLELLTNNRLMTINDVSAFLKISERTLYRYLDLFREAGFIVKKDGLCYSLDHQSKFYRKIADKIYFSTDEAIILKRVLEAVPGDSSQVRHLRAKLASLYDFNVLAETEVDLRIARNRRAIFEAIQGEETVMLRNYISPHRDEMSNRIVEPYLFLPGNNEVRCFELATQKNKTFKLSRIEAVEKVGALWINKEKHKPYYRDLFHFSGEQRMTVNLILGKLAYTILLEEYPEAGEEITERADGRWSFTTSVCSFKGIGRFVLGLFDDIEVNDSPDFSNYLKEMSEKLTSKFSD